MKVELLAVTPDAEKLVEEAGRTCYQSKDKMREGTSADFIKRLIRAGHLSVLEHAYVTIRLKEVSRALTHQLVRHRLCSFSQQSQRYVREDGFAYTIPPKIDANEEAKNIFVDCMENVRDSYKRIQEAGIHREDARYVLPNACDTEIVFSCDFRELRHIIKLRGEIKAQWEIREAFIIILKKMKEIAPNCFDDFEIDEDRRVISISS
jgi:thymidylate synthase (FAD)